MPDCIFCKIINKEIPSYKVYEDENILAFLDINPVNPGHTLVIPKAHYPDMLNMPYETLAQVMGVARKIAPGVLKAVGAEGFNLGLNNGAAAGQIIFHTHFHIMPRFSADGHRLWQGEGMTSDKLNEISDKIRNEISNI